jgi:hypothetical protein
VFVPNVVHRGSRKHVLDLLARRDREAVLAGLLHGTSLRLYTPLVTRPGGWDDDAENTVPEFLHTFLPEWPGRAEFNRWWVTEGKNPTWDLIVLAEGPALLLVEAKAHERELLHEDAKHPHDASKPKAVENDRQIRGCIAEANEWLASHAVSPCALSADRHYQLANRVASVWKLASLGMSVVLVYLGFLGDEYFRDPLIDADHWQRTVGAYLTGVLPLALPGRWFTHANGGRFAVLITALSATRST